MKDLYYSSNQQKYKLFLEENRLREINQEEQQQVIDNELAQKYGLEQQATNIGNLTNRVINKLLTKDVPPLKQTFTPILTESIADGFLTDIFNLLKSSYKVLNKPAVKNEINEALTTMTENNEIPEIVADVMEQMLKRVGVEETDLIEATRKAGRPKGSKSKAGRNMPRVPTHSITIKGKKGVPMLN